MTLLLIFLPACSKQTAQRTGAGAATGAAVGAVGGLVTSLVFGGNVADSVARGAVYGGSTGAAAGAISGTVAENSQSKARQAAELEALRKRLGDDAFTGLEALAQCKHEIALGYGRTAAKSGNPDYALAGLWLQALAYADDRQADQARAMVPDLVAKDDAVSSASEAKTKMNEALRKLKDIRQQYKLPESCN